MDQPKRRGRPLQPHGERKDRTLTFRTRAGLREKLNAAAAASERTATEEVELRLEASFRNDDLRTIIREELRAELRAELRSEIRLAMSEYVVEVGEEDGDEARH